jgi:hypothetical protein
VKAIRLAGPIVTPQLDPRIGANINGPSLLRVPDWLPQRLGKYYLYFAHHQGDFIRMAFADNISGPYTVYAPGVLNLHSTPFAGHIASPDVHVNDARRCIYMYYHGHGCTRENPLPYKQVSCYAESGDGLSFTSDAVYLGPPYLHTFQWNGWHYGFSGGPERCLHRSRDPRAVFETGRQLAIAGEDFTDLATLRSVGIDAPTVYRTRHIAFRQRGHTLEIYYSNVGDEPERIKMTSVDLRPDWTEWCGNRYVEVLRPETEAEGANQPIARSSGGASHTPVHELRDPFVYEEDGRVYLLYTIAGEMGISIAEILPD